MIKSKTMKIKVSTIDAPRFKKILTNILDSMYELNEINIKYAPNEHYEYIGYQVRGNCLDAKKILEQVESPQIILTVMNQILSSKEGKYFKKVLSKTLDTFSQKDIIELDKKFMSQENR